MAFFGLIKKNKVENKEKKVLTVKDLVDELGVAREGVITSYESEENPDDLGPETYIEMQKNDGEVQAIVRLLTLPITSTPIHIIPAEGDKGERDFIETVFTASPNLGGMTTSISFLLADMSRGIFEGFRLYEKVARIIKEGKYKGKIGWRKLAPRDAQTIKLRADEHGGFNGAHQMASFGSRIVSVVLPAEKCMLFTFQKEKHWLYGESILKTAFYHYDKKHKLYYIAHKKAEIEAMGLKILKITNTMTSTERAAAEEVVDTIGINSRITLPPGVELEVERGGGSYDPITLIDHHNLMMARSAITQAVDQVKYAYPYGKGTPSSQFLVLTIESIMNQITSTLNSYAVNPLIDLNFNTKSYPKFKFDKISDITQAFLRDVFDKVLRSKVPLPDGFVKEVINETAKSLNLKWVSDEKKTSNEKKTSKKIPENKKAFESFEKGKIKMANKLGINAPSTPEDIKEKLLRVKNQTELETKCFKLGEEFANVGRRKRS